MTSFYRHIPVGDIHCDYIKYIVGKRGVNFKSCCFHTGVHSIWFNPKRHILQVYGPVHKLDDACMFMEKHLEFVRSIIPDEHKQPTVPNSIVEEQVPDVCVVAHLDGVMYKQDVKYLIGKRGIFFKQFTKHADVSFIWYDEDTHTVTLWGPKDNLSIAIQLLFDHINTLNAKLNTD
jgi:hypothetical protein